MQSTPESRRELIRRLEGIGGASGLPPTLPPSDDGGSGGDMEPRVARLEAHVEHILTSVKKLEDTPVMLARIETRLDALPDKDWVGTKMRNWVGGGVAFLTLVTIAAKFIHLG